MFHSELFYHFTPNFLTILLRTFLPFYSELFYRFTPNFSKIQI